MKTCSRKMYFPNMVSQSLNLAENVLEKYNLLLWTKFIKNLKKKKKRDEEDNIFTTSPHSPIKTEVYFHCY